MVVIVSPPPISVTTTQVSTLEFLAFSVASVNAKVIAIQEFYQIPSRKLTSTLISATFFASTKQLFTILAMLASLTVPIPKLRISLSPIQI